jgi:hypothetical protein
MAWALGFDGDFLIPGDDSDESSEAASISSEGSENSEIKFGFS